MRKKVYGASKVERCPICGDVSTIKNSQKIPVCSDHKSFTIDLKCACGSWLEAREGKYGTYFNCLDCGNISWHKAMVINGLDD